MTVPLKIDAQLEGLEAHQSAAVSLQLGQKLAVRWGALSYSVALLPGSQLPEDAHLGPAAPSGTCATAAQSTGAPEHPAATGSPAAEQSVAPDAAPITDAAAMVEDTTSASPADTESGPQRTVGESPPGAASGQEDADLQQADPGHAGSAPASQQAFTGDGTDLEQPAAPGTDVDAFASGAAPLADPGERRWVFLSTCKELVCVR